MALPFVLAGPVLRRVEPRLVAVWIALSRPASVTLTLRQGRVLAGAGAEFLRATPAAQTLRCGERLHVALAVLKIAAGAPQVLQPGVIYSYDLELRETAGPLHTLASLGLLRSVPTANGGPAGAGLERPHLALGYADDFLPGFALPPARLDDLRLLYGSCRRPANEHPDAMAWMDDLLAEGEVFKEPLKRPHQLVLGGDQIYADDVSALHLQLLNPLANELVGTVPDALSPPWRLPVERVTVDQKHLTGDEEDPVNHPDGWAPGGSTALPAGLTEFPAGRRRQTMLREAQMTTVDGESHLFSFGEFAAMYLMVWSNACWPPPAQWPGAREVLAPQNQRPGLVAPEAEPPVNWDHPTAEDVGAEKGAERYKPCEALRQALARCEKETPGLCAGREAELEACLVPERRKLLEARHAVRKAQLQGFHDVLPKVRRVLANVPTYMMFDDHDATDDWNLNPVWIDRVNGTSLGRGTLRNALASYAVFQDWGNDPLRYETAGAPPRRVLDAVAQMFPAGAPQGPAAAVQQTLDNLFGLTVEFRPKPTLEGRLEAASPPMKWHFSVPGPKHLLVAVDNRTRRDFVSRQGPPGNVGLAVLAEQIPAALPAGAEVLIVVAPLQVVGPALLDELIAPAAYRVFDAKSGDDLAVGPDAEVADRRAQRKAVGVRRMVGTNPDAIEAWAFDPQALEALLARLAPHRRVLLLSGDVHYSAATALSYWTKGNAVPARIVQFTGSGFKNVMPWYIGAVDRVLSFAQRMVRAGVGAERMGWKASTPDAFKLPAGRTLADVPPVLRRKLHHAPMLMPTFGWPEGTKVDAAKLPDWSWRSTPVLDLRPDAQRPAPMRPRALDPDAARLQNILVAHAEPGREPAAYMAVAARHQDQFDRLRHARQILFRANFAQVRFERDAAAGNALTAVHEIHTALADPDAAADAPLKPQAYLVQRASLDGRADEVRPEAAPMRPPAF